MTTTVPFLSDHEPAPEAITLSSLETASQAAADGAAAGFSDVWGLFGDFTRHACVGIFAFRFVEKATWKRTIEFGVEIMRDFPRLLTAAARLSAVRRLGQYLHSLAGSADCHTAFLMGLLLVKAPWAVPLLSANGLLSLARMTLDLLDGWLERLFSRPELARFRAFFRLYRGVRSFVTFLQRAVQTAWQCVLSGLQCVAGPAAAVARYSITHLTRAAALARDLVVAAYHRSTSFLQSIWDRLSGRDAWRALAGA
jgi:hypothetical protein